MTLSQNASKIYNQLTPQSKLGDLRSLAKEIKKDHALAEELWATGELFPRLLGILIMDTKKLDPKVVDRLIRNIQTHDFDQRMQLADWLMANQLTKNKKLISLIESWQNSPSTIKRRIFWYHQGRLRWVGQRPPGNTADLLAQIEEKMSAETPEVQWAMNFTAAWIGIFDREKRDKCIKIGEKLGLYKDEVVPRGCTPNYLPKFIDIEVSKRKL